MNLDISSSLFMIGGNGLTLLLFWKTSPNWLRAGQIFLVVCGILKLFLFDLK